MSPSFSAAFDNADIVESTLLPMKGNDLICFTNCYLLQEDGSIANRDLWVDKSRGVILDAQKTFYALGSRPDTVIDLRGNILSPGLIDIQINGAYNFDFSVYDGDDQKYNDGLDMVACRIVETGVTSLVPTIITQEQTLYPQLLELLRPRTPVPTSEYPNGGATLLGWHAEGPFLQSKKRGAHQQSLLLASAPRGMTDFEHVYGAKNLAEHEDWVMHHSLGSRGVSSVGVGVRILTVAPELPGILRAIPALTHPRRDIIVSIGHSTARADTAARAVRRGARLVTHLFNAMPQLHHRDPGIIGLLGASPASLAKGGLRTSAKGMDAECMEVEAMDGQDMPPTTQNSSDQSHLEEAVVVDGHNYPSSDEVHQRGDSGTIAHKRPFYDIIVDGVHSHPNSVRLAYMAHKDGCILITDAMKILDPNMPDGAYEWRDGRRVVKEGMRLYIEGTDTLAGSVVTLDMCVRNFACFTGCTLGEALRCATYNPAKCLNIENRKGTLRPGADADLVVLDPSGKVLNTWVRGRKVWELDKAYQVQVL